MMTDQPKDVAGVEDASKLEVTTLEAAAAVIAPKPRKSRRRRAPAADTAPSVGPAVVAPIEDLGDPTLYLNRELTWLQFNQRVLNEAADPRVPLLERVKFLAITSSNIDEFFMKRLGGLKQLVGAGVQDLTVDGRTPQQQIDQSIEMIRRLQHSKGEIFRDLIGLLAKRGIVLTTYDRLPDAQREAMREHYFENIFPLVTPLAMDPAHPFPFISNLSLNLLVTLQQADESSRILARVKVPVGAGVPRFIDAHTDDTHYLVPLEDVMAHNLDLLFPGMAINSCEVFRVTRNANTEHDEEQADDLLVLIEAELRDRKFAPIVRLQIDETMAPLHRGMLAAELGLDETDDVYERDVLIGMHDLMEIAGLDIPELHDAPHHSITNDKLQDERNIFHIIRDAGPILLHHPYESFATSVERFVHEASTDPKVLAIKMSFYRTSADTRIIDSLIEAARNGKQVAVVIELKARFDESANIGWASRMEEVGIHVTYGVIGVKTHAKIALVVRKDYDGLRRYAHIGTGNYHAGTARQYADLGLLTCDKDIAKDLTELFNYLTTGCKPSRKYRAILAGPKALKRPLLDKIGREIERHTETDPGLIRFKCNAIEDADIVRALYRASQAGVTVELIVRDTCRLRPGVPGLSETISVVSIVGRFLEHSRIYYFRNGGDEEYFIGSADLMTRNLVSRVEVLAPVAEPALREELRYILETQLADRRSAWDMQPDGGYVQRRPTDDDDAKDSQQMLIERAAKRDFEANRLRNRKLRSIARRTIR